MKIMTRYNKYCLALITMLLSMPVVAQDEYAVKRAAMLKLIEEHVKETSLYLDKQALNPMVMKAMGRVPRHEFVPASQKRFAYENRPLPIGYGQTISQPYMVAVMTDLLKVNSSSKVLEVGTGSAYQAAILSEMVDSVYTIEIIKALSEQASKRVHQFGYNNIHVKTGDGYYGWEEHAPFDVIIVTAAASHVPPPLIKQLKPGGRMVIPVGSRFMTQELLLINKQLDGKLITRQILPVMFVPLTGDH